MRKVGLKSRWPGRSVLVALALAVAVLGLLLLSSSVRAEGPPFPAYATTDVSEKDCLANSDILSTFGVVDDPWPSANYQAQISFTPAEWGVAASADVPIGAIVGKLHADATLGWFNNPCSADYGGLLKLDFDPLMNCSIDSGDTITFADQLLDGNGNGIVDGCDKYPEYLNDMFPGMTPRTRHAGFELYAGIKLSLNFMTFEPGTPIPQSAAPGVPSLGANLGYVAMSVLNDPTAPLVKNQITDNCPPLGTQTTYYGLTKDHPGSSADESGVAWRTNPEYAGTYTFNGYAHSIRDADNDDIDNELDTCPHIANVGDPRVEFSGDADNDGLDNACDPTMNTYNTDPDGDGFPNRQDNCPLVANEGQEDADFDGIGDVCDQDDWNDDGDTTDPGEPTGFTSGTPNGDNTPVWFESDVEISGDSCKEPGEETATPTPSPTASPTGTVIAAVETTLAEDASAGDTEIVVEDATGFAEGDTIKIGTGDTEEECTITAIEDTTFTLDCTLEFDHAAGEPVVKVEAVGLTPTPTVVGVEDICAPVFPGTYNGLVRIDGQPAASGYEVTASVDGVEWGSAIVSGGRYAMDIPDHLPSVPPCFEGGTITFALNEMTCEPTAEWASGIQTVDLDCAPVAPPATATATPPPVTPTPAVTPVAPPPSGAGGLFGSGSGLPLWAIGLASWAGLTIVAGVGTLLAAKRS